MLDFKDAEYLISCPSKEFRPKTDYPEIVFLGKSNVGKSTFINNLVGRKVAFSSKKAGKTKLLNYFLVDKEYYFVDSPGYGYTAYGNREDISFRDMMEGYFVENPYLKGALLLIDSRRGPKEDDLLMISFLKSTRTPYILIYTKSDVAKQNELALCRNSHYKYAPLAIYFSPKGSDLLTLRKAVASLFSL
jgi:GTP-binding protein